MPRDKSRDRSRSPSRSRERSATPPLPETNTVLFSNIAMTVTREQLYQLVSILGRIDKLQVYPTETNANYHKYSSKMCYVKYLDRQTVAAAQHLSNTVLIDRIMIVTPVPEDEIPDEESALRKGAPPIPGSRQLPPSVVNQLSYDENGQQVLQTVDPQLSALGLPPYPPLPANTEAGKVEEIRRTVYVGNLPKDVDPKQLVDFFSAYIGEVMYIRMAGSDRLPCRYAYVEFTNQVSVPVALQNDGIDYFGAALRIQHSRVAIIKPHAKTNAQAQQEVEDAMRVQNTFGQLSQQSTNAMTNAVKANPTRTGWATATAPVRRLSPASMMSRRSRSPRRSPRRSRSPRRRRSPSPDRRRRRDDSRERRKRSRSRERSSRRRSRSRERSRREESKSSKRDRSRERKKESKRDRDRSKDRKSSKSDRKEKEIKKELEDAKKEREEKERKSQAEKEKEFGKAEASGGEDAMDTSQAETDEAAAIREKLLADLNKKDGDDKSEKRDSSDEK